MELFILQVMPTLQQSDTTSTIIAIAVFAFFILFLVIAGMSGSSGSSGGGGGATKKSSKFSKRKFRRYASSRGLSRGETHILEDIIRRHRVHSPYSLLNNTPLLDTNLRKTLDEIEASAMDPDEREAQKLTLYRIKQKIERSTKGVKPPSSSRQLKLGQSVSLSINNVRYQTKVTTNLEKSFGVEVPKDKTGTEIRWRKWTKAQIFFWRANGQSFSFDTKILGYNVIRGISSLFLQHTGSIKEAQQRRYRRKSLERPAYFYPIRIISSGFGKNASRKAIVDKNRGTLATLIDISAGGCAMRTSYPLGRGELLKMEFETEKRQKVTVFGKVMGMTRIYPSGGIMHIMFTRVSRAHMNRINSFIYSFEQSRERRYPRL